MTVGALLMPGGMRHRTPAPATLQAGDQQEQWPAGPGQCQARAMPDRAGLEPTQQPRVMCLGHVAPPGSAAHRGLATCWALRAADLVRGHRGCPSATLGRPSVDTSAAQPSQLGEARESPGMTSVSRAFGAGAPS